MKEELLAYIMLTTLPMPCIISSEPASKQEIPESRSSNILSPASSRRVLSNEQLNCILEEYHDLLCTSAPSFRILPEEKLQERIPFPKIVKALAAQNMAFPAPRELRSSTKLWREVKSTSPYGKKSYLTEIHAVRQKIQKKKNNSALVAVQRTASSPSQSKSESAIVARVTRTEEHINKAHSSFWQYYFFLTGSGSALWYTAHYFYRRHHLKVKPKNPLLAVNGKSSDIGNHTGDDRKKNHAGAQP